MPHLNDDKVYKKLDVDLTEEVDKLYKQGLINKDMKEFCSPPDE